MKEYKVELFHRWDCPYSKQVRTYIEENNLKNFVILLDVEDKNNLERLSYVSGKTQVPCLLVDDEEVILESKKIVAWMEEHLPHAEGSTG